MPHLHLNMFFQMCSCCDDALEAATAVQDQPYQDLDESETAEISCHGSPSASDSQTQTAAQ